MAPLRRLAPGKYGDFGAASCREKSPSPTGPLASSVCDLYQCRWSIETRFKELKQTMQLVDFLGHSANAVQRQVWTALLVHLLLRFQAWQSRWTHSFTRLTTYIRAALWLERDLYALLKRCGTADGDFRCLGSPEQAWLPDFARSPVGQPV